MGLKYCPSRPWTNMTTLGPFPIAIGLLFLKHWTLWYNDRVVRVLNLINNCLAKKGNLVFLTTSQGAMKIILPQQVFHQHDVFVTSSEQLVD